MFIKRMVIWHDSQGKENNKLCNNEQELRDLYAFLDKNQFYSTEYLYGKCMPGEILNFNKMLIKGGDSN